MLVAVSGCQCAQLPNLIFACPDARGCEVPDAGPDSGGDAGLFCNTWTCVEARWAPPADAGFPGFTSFALNLDPGVDAGLYGVLGWFGGVLLPSGKVLAIPHRVPFVLEIDPDPLNHSVRQFGPRLASGVDRKWAGGVLTSSGIVFAFPYEEGRMLRIDPADASVERWGPDLQRPDGGPPHYVGGVIDKFGFIWSVSENELEAYPVIRVDPSDGGVATFIQKGRWSGWWGMSRLPDDRLVAFPKEFTTNGSPYILEISPGPTITDATLTLRTTFDASDSGMSLQGGAMTRSGVLVVAPSSLQGQALLYDPRDGGTQLFPIPGIGVGFLGTHGDGYVYSSPDHQMQALRLSSDAGVQLLTSPFGADGDRYGWLGMVATPVGLVGIPGNRASVLVFQAGTPEQRPIDVLLSPWFNKL